MTTIKKVSADADEYLLKCWLEELKTVCYAYIEPFLDSVTVDLIKQMCDALKQDSHVFVMSVDLLVQYITIQNNRNVLIEDQLLVVICIIFICSKQVGEQSELKSKIIAKLYSNITQQETSDDAIKQMEISILITLQYKLPLYSRIDDLKIFITAYLQQFNLRIDITGLCVQILDLVYIYYRRLFYKLKNVYKQNPDALEAFKDMITNRLYLPCGILLCALELTKLKHFLNVQNILHEISEICEMHHNHIELLSKYIYNIVNSRNHATSNT